MKNSDRKISLFAEDSTKVVHKNFIHRHLDPAHAGLKPWPRLIQNLRASCATDWADEYPMHESSKWLGHSPTVAAKHYLQSKDLHFKAVMGTGPWLGSAPATGTAESGSENGAQVAQNAAQQAAASSCTERE
jgi:hypothetical protein